MSIDHNTFLDWAVRKFGADNVDERGPEICINSPYTHEPDHGYHCQCNPSINGFHCWKSDEHGNLYAFVMEQEGCSYPEAEEILGDHHLLANLEEKIRAFFTPKKQIKKTTVLAAHKSLLSLPPDTFLISALRPDNRLRRIAEDYLTGRKIPIDGLYVCASGRYANRIVIPYYGPDKQLIYFNCRDMTGRSPLRYQGPPKQVGVGKGDVIWIQEWPESGSSIHITEGEFDAMSLRQAELNGAAVGGKNLSNKQLQLIKYYRITLCFDLDVAGLEALVKISEQTMKTPTKLNNLDRFVVKYTKPARGYKDWNDMLMQLGNKVLHQYIKETEKAIDWDEFVKLKYKL